MKTFCTHLLVVFIVLMASSSTADEIELINPATSATQSDYVAFVERNAPSEEAFVAIQRIAYRFIQARQWESAAEMFRIHKYRFPDMSERFDKTIDLLLADEEGLEIKNLGSGVNSNEGDYKPVPTADGKLLYFTGDERSDGLGYEDIFVSEFRNGKWGQATNMGTDLNTEENYEAALSISADGNKILVFGNYDESFGRGDNFWIRKTRTGWGNINHFPRPINSEYFDANGFETADGSAILFTSDRPGGIGEFHKKNKLYHGNAWGNHDIYVCLKTPDGFGEAINLGPTINTPYCEYTPFLHPDGKTLYFSSDGHYGLGDLDVFKSTRLNEDSWTEWSEPVNLGKEINTSGWDWGYTVATSGDIAYFAASDKEGGYGENDIYSITLPKEARPEAVATVRGTVTDGDGNFIEAGIAWEDLVAGDSVGLLESNPQDGSYFIVLPLGKKYGYYASAEGYYPVSKNIDLVDKTEAVDTTVDIVLVSIAQMKETGEVVRINNIFFEFNKYELLQESHSELNRLADILKADPETRVEIAGHTDSIDTEEYNDELSRKRAQSVVTYLVSVGCREACLIAKGYGESKPIADNATEQGRAENRRVEFRFLERDG